MGDIPRMSMAGMGLHGGHCWDELWLGWGDMGDTAGMSCGRSQPAGLSLSVPTATGRCPRCAAVAAAGGQTRGLCPCPRARHPVLAERPRCLREVLRPHPDSLPGGGHPMSPPCHLIVPSMSLPHPLHVSSISPPYPIHVPFVSLHIPSMSTLYLRVPSMSPL